MSWQAYIDSSLVGSGQVDKACIVSAAGDSVWATSANFTVKPEEMKVIVGAYADSKQGDDLWANGLHVAGDRYVVTKFEDRSLYARKGRDGVVIVKTTQAILIAHYGENVVAGNAAITVEKLGDYLIGLGY